MSRSLATFLGFSSLIAWIQTIDYLYLTRDTTIHNGSFVACVVFVMTLLLYGLINRLVAIEPTREFLLGTAFTASACGMLYAITNGPEVRLILFCLQMTCSALLIVAWGQTLTLFAYRKLLLLVCAGGLCSAAMLLFCTLVLPGLALIATSVLPSCSGIFLLFARGKPGGIDERGGRARHTANNGFFTFEPIEAETLKNLPWMLLIVLCLCTFAASLFGGLATNPYLVNSQTLMVGMLVLTAASIAMIGAGSELFFRWQDRRLSKDGAVDRSAPTDVDTLESAHDLAQFVQPIIGLSLILLVSGLMLFSMKLPGTMTIALSMVLGAKNCLIMVCWIVFPRAIADARLPFIPCFALLVLANGTLYAPYLGVWINKSIGVDFRALTATATVLIAFVAVLALFYMIVRMKQINAEQHPETENAPASLTLEDIRDALRAHQQKMMEPYGLTEREQQIIAMIADGQTLGGIAEELYITERTVKFHSKNAYDKLGVRSKKELMQMFSKL